MATTAHQHCTCSCNLSFLLPFLIVKVTLLFQEKKHLQHCIFFIPIQSKKLMEYV